MNDFDSNSEEKLIESILIVDDQPANLRVLSKMLEGKDYKVKKASDGESAIIAAQSNPPDLILLDILMPNMDGYEVCEKLKSEEKTKDIPVIFISALSDVFDKIKAFEVGGIDYITKPFQEEEVLARITSQLTIQTQRKLLEKEQLLLKKEQENLRKEIRQRKEAEAILYQSRALISSILNASLDGIAALEAVRDPKTGKIEDFRCIVVNPVTAKIFNSQPENLTGKLLFKRFISKIKPELFPAFIRVIETGKALEQDIKYHYKNEQKWFHFIAVKLGDGFSITVRDITVRKKLELKLSKLATIDGLTGIYNRHYFDNTLIQEWQRSLRGNQPLSLILCDVDYFKPYNDIYGHPEGDKCLIKVAQIMDNIVKRSSDFLARYGGEEFAIILPNTNIKGAVNIAEKIRAEILNLKIPHQGSKVSEYITLSLGVASFKPSFESSIEMLIKLADNALYQAKNNGRNQVYFNHDE
ncbi:pole remodelling regulatory diguanylate cyclase [Geminocystis sp. NIES-3708]|uniref:diguanylate cyclase domain-containing protein n=1 Tax=Geminocystis sp. NIES-3708 TaxID=1615909 RepID=UPI0005FCB674|nr:diguanylate cyclase [Geminocystis sp. NIES-3708]BAQ60399.1 pole remodelling regulatory diguanylate cyclase [Geminocystis sp. NIES-3708]